MKSLRMTLIASLLLTFAPALLGQEKAAIRIDDRRELFVDDYLLDRLSGAQLEMQKPTPQEVVITCDHPWEGNTSAYFTLFQDGPLYRMYYRGSHSVDGKKPAHEEVACYAESKDGIHWTKPKLGLHEFAGSKDNNIVYIGDGAHNFTPFKDPSPAAKPESRYKALARQRKKGLVAFQSADGVRWSLIQDAPVITDGAFDSQNLAFWDAERKLYVDYHRKFMDGVRGIMTCTSPDFLNWTKPIALDYGKAPNEHLYTNAVQPYSRSPHLYIGFPTRFQPKTQQVEPVLMTSRDGVRFQRWPEPVVPITAPKDRDGNRSNYMAWGVLELPGKPGELSVYATEAYYAGPGSRLRRFTYRTDGFVALHAATHGEVVTRPITFKGNRLELNLHTSAKGKVAVEIQDVAGKAIPGFSLADATPLRGDQLAGVATWKGGADVSKLATTPVRLRFVMNDADLYSMKFENKQ